ncbi:transglutaminase [Hoeflea olei]|uniref:Transglutaminase n=2 Tax=Hoeflea olei TaxID=1480615 RepID=A0A1C1YR90_9HYPH|nr:transglutaminase-like cysteine peptidase [Hoeflea olei]OCW55936.1 transglutaminase [Hoeflea olei]
MLCGPGLTKRALIALIASVVIPAGGMASDLSMRTGRITSQPIGHYEFCQKHANECGPVKGSGAAPKVTDYGWDVIREINRAVNFSVMPKTDMELYGKEEVWAYPDVAGDCEDYVLLKRRMLIERGFSPGDVLITVVRKPDGEGHAVLTLRTSEGDFVLDNLVDEIKNWRETPYSYLKRQASNSSGRWVTIENGSDVLVGALK